MLKNSQKYQKRLPNVCFIAARDDELCIGRPAHGEETLHALGVVDFSDASALDERRLNKEKREERMHSMRQGKSNVR